MLNHHFDFDRDQSGLWLPKRGLVGPNRKRPRSERFMLGLGFNGGTGCCSCVDECSDCNAGTTRSVLYVTTSQTYRFTNFSSEELPPDTYTLPQTDLACLWRQSRPNNTWLQVFINIDINKLWCWWFYSNTAEYDRIFWEYNYTGTIDCSATRNIAYLSKQYADTVPGGLGIADVQIST
jgi:hypothetical protein